jgi:hypothetical protein
MNSKGAFARVNRVSDFWHPASGLSLMSLLQTKLGDFNQLVKKLKKPD